MPVPTKRFTIYGEDTNKPVSDFMSTTNGGVTNTSAGGDGSSPPTSGVVKESDLLDSLPAIDGILSTKTDVTKKFIQQLHPDSITHVLNKELSETLGTDMGRIFKNTSRTLPTSILMNKVMRKLPQTECERDLNSLLRLLKQLGLPYDIQFDINAALAALLAILFKLACAGVKGAFGKIFGISSNGELLASAAAGYLIATTKQGMVEPVIDVASTPVAGLLRERVPNIANIAASAASGYIHVPDAPGYVDKPLSDVHNDLKNALDTLDPEWKGVIPGVGLDLGRMKKDVVGYENLIETVLSDQPVTVDTTTLPAHVPSEDVMLAAGIGYLNDVPCNLTKYGLKQFL